MDHPAKQSFWMEKNIEDQYGVAFKLLEIRSCTPTFEQLPVFLAISPWNSFQPNCHFSDPLPPMTNLFLPFQVRLLFLGKRSIFEEFNSSKSVWNRNHRAFVVQVPCSRLEYNDIGYFSWNQGMNGLKRIFFGNKQSIWSKGFHFVSISFPVVPELSLMWSQFYCIG